MGLEFRSFDNGYYWPIWVNLPCKANWIAIGKHLINVSRNVNSDNGYFRACPRSSTRCPAPSRWRGARARMWAPPPPRWPASPGRTSGPGSSCQTSSGTLNLNTCIYSRGDSLRISSFSFLILNLLFSIIIRRDLNVVFINVSIEIVSNGIELYLNGWMNYLSSHKKSVLFIETPK